MVLDATNREAQAAYEAYARLPEGDPRRQAAQPRLEHWLGYGDKDIERHREELDSITDTIAMAGAITVGIAATILSGGAAGVALLPPTSAPRRPSWRRASARSPRPARAS